MHATQSNTASNFLRSDSTDPNGSGSGRSRDLAPPSSSSPLAPAFLSPIQAARRYLERQRGGAMQAGQLSGIGEHPGSEPTSRAQDRRLERSLYAGHSIEAGLAAGLDAGLDAEGLYGTPYGALKMGGDSGQDSGQGRQRAYLAASDGSEPRFPYEVPYLNTAKVPEADPNAVRGAIERLARESGATFEPSQTAFSSVQPEVLTVIESQRGPSAFAEVARRVWETHRSDEGTPTGRGSIEATGPPEPLAQRQAAWSEAIVASIPLAAEADSALIGAADGGPVPSLSGSSLPVQSSLPPEASRPGQARCDSTSQTTASRATTFRETELRETGFQETACDGAALAHDACNLLSALGLYGDLLSAPGVLDGPHLRYAEELKLIAGRSQSLIDRLLRVKGEAGATPLDAEPAGPAASPASDLPHLVNARAAQQSAIHLARGPEAPASAVPDAGALARGSQITSLVDLLMRWGSLLSTLALGTLDVAFGPDAATPVPVAAEPLERILVNLVKNARAAIAGGGAIRIGVGVREDLRQRIVGPRAASANPPETSSQIAPASRRSVVLTVDDSGCGMSEDEVDWIMGIAPHAGAETVSDGYGRWTDEAVASVTAQARSLGPIVESGPELGYGGQGRRRGLGLQVVKELVAASGGSLAIQSRPGTGTRIEISWPVPDASGRTGAPVEMRQLRSDPNLVAQPVSVLPPQVAAAVPAQPVIGPDGFSERELRAMMLRLHRGGPPDPDNAGRPQDGGGPDRVGARRAEEGNYCALKGAIAC